MYCQMNSFSNSSFNNSCENIFSQRDEDDVVMYGNDDDAFSDVFDDDSAFSDVDDQVRSDDEDSEDEMYEEDDEDNEIAHAIRMKLLREQNKKSLEGLSSVSSLLTWKNRANAKPPMIPVDPEFASEFPTFEDKKIKMSVRRPVRKSPTSELKPAKFIKIKVGNKTFIEFKQPEQCKTYKSGKVCKFGDKCKFSHEGPVTPEKNTSSILCKFIRDGEVCKFGDKCKFSHEKREAVKKPMCRKGSDCENKKCTFTHPVQKQRTPHASPSATSTSSLLLCKNMFKIENGAIIETGKKCKFGDSCSFAHGWTVVRDRISSGNFKCKFDDKCSRVKVEFIKKNVDGSIKTIRRYTNSGTNGKCFKIHSNERVKDFIIRTQQPQ